MHYPFNRIDGIRALANQEPMTPMTMLRLGQVLGRMSWNGSKPDERDDHPVVVLGKDTRLSGYTLEPALCAGLASVGVNVVLLGPLPTPGVARLTQSFRADFGIILTASHNGAEWNGLKLFDRQGYRPSDEMERAIIEALRSDNPCTLAQPDKLGRVKRIEDAAGRYTEFAKSSFPRHLRLDGLRIVVDSANGGAYKAAHAVLFELGAEVITIGDKPDGLNINRECGTEYPRALTAEVRKQRADVGISLDGDADRVVICDERGMIIDSDQILGLIASMMLNQKGSASSEEVHGLRGGHVVGTVMTNLGLKRFLEAQGVGLIRAKVGDRYVIEEMQRSGCNLGGEQSGHIILGDWVTTGDGIITALQFLAALVERGGVASTLRVFNPVPQFHRNVSYVRERATPLEDPRVQKAISAAEEELGPEGVVARHSETEDRTVRMTCQGDNAEAVERHLLAIEEAVRSAT